MLTIKGIRAGYGVPVLHDIHMSIGSGEAVAIVGANGAGKTTLVRCLAGLVTPMAGTMEMDGVDITAVPGHKRPEHGIAMVLEGRNLFTEMTIMDNLRLAEHAGRRVRHDSTRFTLDEVLALFDVVRERAHSRVGLLSGGQQQMVAIARALLLQPKLLVMDELTTGLAPKIVKEILAILNKLRARGMSILLVEQSVAIASEMTERAYVLSVGRVIHEVPQGGWPQMLSNKDLVKAYLHG